MHQKLLKNLHIFAANFWGEHFELFIYVALVLKFTQREMNSQ